MPSDTRANQQMLDSVMIVITSKYEFESALLPVIILLSKQSGHIFNGVSKSSLILCQ